MHILRRMTLTKLCHLVRQFCKSLFQLQGLGSGATVIPAELQYVEVIAVTAKSGNDANTGEKLTEEQEKELPSTVTMLVRPQQSKLLARLEAEGDIHLSLVFRGEADKALAFIKAQDQVLEEMKALEATAEETKDGTETDGEE